MRPPIRMCRGAFERRAATRLAETITSQASEFGSPRRPRRTRKGLYVFNSWRTVLYLSFYCQPLRPRLRTPQHIGGKCTRWLLTVTEADGPKHRLRSKCEFHRYSTLHVRNDSVRLIHSNLLARAIARKRRRRRAESRGEESSHRIFHRTSCGMPCVTSR